MYKRRIAADHPAIIAAIKGFPPAIGALAAGEDALARGLANG